MSKHDIGLSISLMSFNILSEAADYPFYLGFTNAVRQRELHDDETVFKPFPSHFPVFLVQVDVPPVTLFDTII